MTKKIDKPSPFRLAKLGELEPAQESESMADSGLHGLRGSKTESDKSAESAVSTYKFSSRIHKKEK